MKGEARQSGEWVDGFVFVGNQLALDLVNTGLLQDGERVELLPDVAALGKWLVAAGLLPPSGGKALIRRWRGSPEAEAFLQSLVAFRERLRVAVLRYEAGKAPGAGFVAELNRLLRQHPVRATLSQKAGKLVREVEFKPVAPGDVWAPIAAAAAELLTEVPASRVRKCESCIAHFRDISRKGSRRWCSMNLCGNRLKVAAYQQRRRAVES